MKLNKPRENRESIKSNSVNVPLTDVLKEKVDQKANENQTSNGGFVRMVLEDFFKKEERF